MQPTTNPQMNEIQEKPSIIPYAIIETITNLDNIYEARLFGWVVAKAQSVLKLYNKDLSAINIEHAMNLTRVTLPARYLLQETDKNYSNVTKAFGLATKKIIYERDNRLYHLNVIAFPELVKDGRFVNVTFVIHNELWHALLDFTKGYRLFNLSTYIRLSSKYTIVLYLLITQQNAPQTYLIGTLRRILGCEKLKAYDRGANFFARVIEPARKELMSKAPYYFDYTASKTGRDHKYTEIVIAPKMNPNYSAPGDAGLTKTVNQLRVRLAPEVTSYIQDFFGNDVRSIERIENILINYGNTQRQLEKLEEIKRRCLVGRVKNRAGYLVRTLTNL